MLLALIAVAGLSNAVTQPAINLFMADQVPLDRQGIAFGIKQSAIPVAVLVSGLALPLVALPLGWREAFVLFAVAALGVAAVVRRSAASFVAPRARARPPRPSRALVVTAIGAALGSAGPNSLGAYLVASAVDIGIAEGAAGVLAAVGSGVSLITRIGFGQRADRRADYGFGAVVGLLAAGSTGFALLASDSSGSVRGRRGDRLRDRLGLARPLQPGRGRPQPRGARGGHRRDTDRHLRGGRRGAAGVRPAVDRDRLLGRLAGRPGRSACWPRRRLRRRPG